MVLLAREGEEPHPPVRRELLRANLFPEAVCDRYVQFLRRCRRKEWSGHPYFANSRRRFRGLEPRGGGTLQGRCRSDSSMRILHHVVTEDLRGGGVWARGRRSGRRRFGSGGGRS